MLKLNFGIRTSNETSPCGAEMITLHLLRDIPLTILICLIY